MHKKQMLKILGALICMAMFMSLQNTAFAQETKPRLTIIKAGKLIDTLTGRVLTDQKILIEGERIKEVGSNVTVTDGARFIDLSEMTVLPGLIDSHTHITGQSGDFQKYQNPWIDTRFG